MRLNIQIYSLIYSFLFGIFFYFILDIYNKLSNKLKIWIKIIVSLIFSLFISIIYFIGLLYINNGCLHVYFLVVIGLGSYFSMCFINFWFTHCKKK